MPAVRTLLLALALAACATTPTPRGVAQDFAACFEGWPRSATHERDWPLSARCPCLRDADAACLRAGYPAGCWRDGWADSDHDAWGVAACDDRARRGM